MTTIYLVSNSPGEVSTFARPVASALHRRHPEWELQVALVPCPYATGAEASVVRTWPERPQVWTPWQTFWSWLTATERGQNGVVCFLGGDPWHALTLGKRFAMPALAYFPDRTSWLDTTWAGGFAATALGYDPEEPRYIGDLRVDAVEARLAQVDTESPGTQTLALFPGSRWLHLKATLGPYLYTVEQVAARHPECRFVLSASPFITHSQLADAAKNPLNLGLSKVRSELVHDCLRTENGTVVEVRWGEQYRVIKECDLAISLPGTNTAELAIAGKPTVVPLSSRVPVGGAGLLGLLDRLPGITPLKRALRLRKAERLQLIALPNQLAGRKVIPEFIIRDDMSDLVDVLSDLLQDHDKRQNMGREVREVMGHSGAADRFVDLIEECLNA